jgi:hypothetical protein
VRIEKRDALIRHFLKMRSLDLAVGMGRRDVADS